MILSNSFASAPASLDDSPARSSYRPEIDGLRAFAIIAVIINHFNEDLLPSGYLGVDIFFVISGYVITSSLANRAYKNFGDFLLGFYTRRVKRLVPALVVCVVITSTLICLFNPNPYLSLKTGIASLLSSSNLYLLKHSTDYFALSTELNVFTHTWSLGVEEQFYVLFPFLVWFTGFSRSLPQGSRNLYWVTGAFTLGSLVIFIYLNHTNQPAAYFLMPSRLWELGAGCLVFLGLRSSSAFSSFLKRVPPTALLASIVTALFIPRQLAVKATIIVVLLTTVLIASLRQKTISYELLTNPKVVYLGLISYSLYLWHWSILSISRWTIGIHWWSVPIQVSLILLFAIASYQYIEKPLRLNEWSVLRWKSIVYGCIACFSASIFVAILGKQFPNPLYLGKDNSLAKIQKIDLNGKQCIFSGNVPACSLDNGSASKIHKVPTLWIVGDSHAQHLAGIAKPLKERFHVNIAITSFSGYPFPPNPVIKHKTDIEAAKNGLEMQRKIRATIRPLLKDNDIILIANSGSYTVNGTDKMVFPVSEWNGNSQHQFLSRLETSLKEFYASRPYSGIKIIYMLPLPRFEPYEWEECQPQWFRVLPEKCHQLIPIKKMRASQDNSLYSLVRRIEGSSPKNLYFYDPLNSFCLDGKCSNEKNGSFYFYDGSHLTKYGAKIVAKDISNFFDRQKLLR